MKLTNTKLINRKAGLTLLELTVVILVLLSLVSILFIGARAWKKGSDRAASIMNIRNVQQAVRSHQNMYALNEGDPLPSADAAAGGTEAEPIAAVTTPIFGAGRYLNSQPTHPIKDATYDFLEVVPELGDLYMFTDYVPDGAGGNPADYNPTEHGDW